MSTRIRFERTVNTGQYENFRLGAELDLADGEDLAAALRGLQARVDEMVDERFAAVCPGQRLPRSLHTPPPAPIGRTVEEDPF